MARRQRYFDDDFNLSANAHTSDVVNTNGLPLSGLSFPSAWSSGVTVVSILASHDVSGSYQTLYTDDGTQATVTAGADRAVGLSSAVMESARAFQYLKLGVETAQASDRIVTAVMRSG